MVVFRRTLKLEVRDIFAGGMGEDPSICNQSMHVCSSSTVATITSRHC
jgi:hypothetical protein